MDASCLIVDDDADLRLLVQGYLDRFGIEVVGVPDAAAMDQALRRRHFDLILLDVVLPDEDGLLVCKRLRQVSAMPIIMLTARNDLMHRVLGLDLGADDYLGKPFDPCELLARINAVLRRFRAAHRAAAATSVSFAGWTFDRLQRRLLAPGGSTVELSNVECRLLSTFIDNAGRLLSRDQLLDLARGRGIDAIDRSIDLSVSRLRQKLGESSRDPRIIRTVRGQGYVFAVDVGS
jgi:two-component system OmpR family response regulator